MGVITLDGRNMKKLILIAFMVLYCGKAFCIDTNGYVEIEELRGSTTKLGIYFIDDQQHLCSDGIKTRFVAEPSMSHHVSMLMMAFAANMPVKLQYFCDESGVPLVSIVRVR